MPRLSIHNLALVWTELEQLYSENAYNGHGINNEVFLEQRSSDLLFIAPHALNHFRKNKVKRADLRTGALAELLAMEFNASALIPRGIIPAQDDWGLREDNFRLKLDEAVNSNTFALDLHGMKNTGDIEICLGTGPYPSERVMEFASQFSLELSEYNAVINMQGFAAKSDVTITSYLQTQALSVDCIQVEIARKFRQPHENPEVASKFFTDFANAIRKTWLSIV